MKPGEMETAPEPCQVENPEVSLPSPLMVLENVRENVSSYMLTMLVENISDLSEEDGNFSVEMIPELRAAVVTFTGNAGKEKSGLFFLPICFCVRGRGSKWEVNNVPSHRFKEKSDLASFEMRVYGSIWIYNNQ